VRHFEAIVMMRTGSWKAVLLGIMSVPFLEAALAVGADRNLSNPYYIEPRSGAQHVSLDGDWELGYRDAPIDRLEDLATVQKWIRARVPTTVQWALFRNGDLPDPYAHLNSKKYEWMDEKVWYHRRSFDLPASARGSYIFLCFDGIDYYARVWLNGALLGHHEGMFGGPAVEVSQQVKYGGSNELTVEVRAGNWGQKKSWHFWKPGRVVRPWILASGTGAEAFFPFGMWRGVRLEIVPRVHLERPFLVTEGVTNGEARLALTVEVLAAAHSLESELHPWEVRHVALPGFRNAWTSRLFGSRVTLDIQFNDKGSFKPIFQRSLPLRIYEGRNWVKDEIRIPGAKLWWPNGMGSPHLYRVRLTVRQDGQSDALEFDYGIRTIRTQPTTGPRTQDRWGNWQFVVNGRPLFVKGINWMTADLLLDLPRERYRWPLNLATAAGIQMLRAWGGGLIETEDFYAIANELGLMVWQDFAIGNTDTPDWPQDVWEAQVVQNIIRIRNHPALVLYCGGNEFNPYSLGNATSVGIFERSVRDFDGTRPFRRTDPDEGSIHVYPGVSLGADPTWYSHLYRLVPFVSETGIENMPEPQSLLEIIDEKELLSPYESLFGKEFDVSHPEFAHHCVGRTTPRTFRRASHIDNISNTTLAAVSEAVQAATGEYYQILSDAIQGNYPVTAGLMPWVFNRPWPVVYMMMVDGFGQPTPAYYFLKRTYEPVHITVSLPNLIWSKEEEVPVEVRLIHAPQRRAGGLVAAVEVLDQDFRPLWRRQCELNAEAGPSVTSRQLGTFVIPQTLEDRFFFMVAEVKDRSGKLLSRSVYWPRCLKLMADAKFREGYRKSPQPSPTLDKGPWLKRQVASTRTSLELRLISSKDIDAQQTRLQVDVRNSGPKPAFMTQIDIQGAKRAFQCTDNFFWLAPGEERLLQVEVLWREPVNRQGTALALRAWNAEPVRLPLPVPRPQGSAGARQGK